MELTKEEAIRLHRELWRWLVENPDKEKENWPGWEQVANSYPQIMESASIKTLHCFACYMTQDCDKCLLVWPGLDCSNETEGDGKGLFERWNWTKRIKQRAKLAAQIRDLPVREEVPNAPTT